MRLVIFLLLCPILIQAQIVNIEKLRLSDTLSNHFSMEIGLGMSMSRNSSGDVLEGEGSLKGDYQFNNKNRIMMIGAFGINRFRERGNTETTDINNNQFIHFRYNRKLTSFMTWEAFSQGQFNQVELINLRLLAGTGPRFQLLRKEKGYIYLGLLYMFEHSDEEWDGISKHTIFNHHRLSGYLNMFYKPNDNLGISHVTYIQPRVDAFHDLRISSETGLEFKIFKKLNWRTYFQLLYDSSPPISVIELRYQFKNGLNLKI